MADDSGKKKIYWVAATKLSTAYGCRSGWGYPRVGYERLVLTGTCLTVQIGNRCNTIY
jgi:hypothetical protein